MSRDRRTGDGIVPPPTAIYAAPEPLGDRRNPSTPTITPTITTPDTVPQWPLPRPYRPRRTAIDAAHHLGAVTVRKAAGGYTVTLPPDGTDAAREVVAASLGAVGYVLRWWFGGARCRV